MKKIQPLKRILLTLLVIILLPALFYSAFEINSLSNREKMIEEIYQQQLETILFSVNQYSWDVANNWASKINILYEETTPSAFQNIFADFLSRNQTIQAIFLVDSGLTDLTVFSSRQSNDHNKEAFPELAEILHNNRSLLQQLHRYKTAGYRKIEPLQLLQNGESDLSRIILLFHLDRVGYQKKHQVAGILINPSIFIEEVLTPKLAEIAKDRFYLAVFHQNQLHASYPSASFVADTELADIRQKEEIWLFPQFYLGISPLGQTIAELTRGRFYRNLILIGLLDILLIAGVWLVYRNIRKEMELTQIKTNFVSNISHELRTPLSLIRMFTETLQMNRLRSEERKKQYYQYIGQETERLSHLVNNILNFSRIEAGKKQYQLQEMNLNDVVNNVLTSYQFHLRNEGFQFKTSLASTLPDIQADSDAVSESLINLIDNAIKYSDAEKFIRIETGSEDGFVYLEVEDHGIGIPAEHKERIFEKFYRVSDSLVHNTKGSGLGLSLVKHIMDAHHGRIDVNSSPGKGSRFRLVFNV